MTRRLLQMQRRLHTSYNTSNLKQSRKKKTGIGQRAFIFDSQPSIDPNAPEPAPTTTQGPPPSTPLVELPPGSDGKAPTPLSKPGTGDRPSSIKKGSTFGSLLSLRNAGV